MRIDPTTKSMGKIFIRFMFTFVLIYFSILFFNTLMPLFFIGFSEFNLTEFKTTSIFYLSIFVYSMFVAFAAKSTSVYFDMFMIFSKGRKTIMRTINFFNVLLTLGASCLLNAMLLMIDIPQRLFFGVMITLSLYLILNFMNFIAFLGKIFGWHYIVGSFILLASFIILTVNYIGGLIQFGLYKVEISVFLILSAAVFFCVNNFILSKRYEYKN